MERSPDGSQEDRPVQMFRAGRVLRWEEHDGAVLLRIEGKSPPGTGTTSELSLAISVLEAGAVRLVLGPAAERDPGSPADGDEPPAPLAVTSTPDGIQITSERHGGYGPEPEDVTIQVGLGPLSVAVVDAAGRTVVRLAPAEGEGEPGRPAVAPLAWTEATGPDRRIAISFALEPDERLYGLGERAGPLDLVGGSLDLPATDPTAPDAPRPFLLSSRGYGVLVRTPAPLHADLGTRAPSSYTLAVDRDEAELLVFPATWPRTALAAYARLTDRAPVPASRSFGLLLLQGPSDDQVKTEATLARLHAAGLPCEDPGADPFRPSLLERELAALVDSPADRFTGASEPIGPPADASEMGALLRRGLSFGLSTPGFWQANLAPAHGRPPPDPNLLVRWAQLALLGPLVRSDAATLDRLWSQDARLRAIVAAYTRLRYRLLPYLLHCARETAEAGLPMLRPLFLEFSWDAEVGAIDDQLLLGRDLLIAPVASASPEPVTRRVYLPAYANWYDWWTGALHRGGQWLDVRVPLDRVPLYARAGTTIPLADPRASIGGAPVDVSRLLLFAPVDGAVGASVELADGDMLGVEQARGPDRAKVYVEGLPGSIRDLVIVGLPPGTRLVDAASPAVAVVADDASLPGLGGTWDALTVGLDVGAYTTGLELSW